MLQPLLDELNTMGKLFILQGDQLTLPTREDKHSVKYRKYISGEWFEYLIENWLRDSFPEAEIESSLRLIPHQKKQGKVDRDADLVVLNRGRLLVIELKADLHQHNQASDQLESLKNSAGAKLDSLLLLSPQTWKRSSIKDHQAFSHRVSATNSRLGLAIDQQSVVDLVTGRVSTNWPVKS